MDAQLRSFDLYCHRCGYDLRAHPAEGKCPECATSIAESREFAAIPVRPNWRDSDARWRRRMLAGAWILVLMPIIDALRAFRSVAGLTVPSVFDWRGPLRFDETFLFGWGWRVGAYEPLMFCIGAVLLFSKERGRRRGRLDWTRRWGVLCSYIVLLLSASEILFISALVSAGIGACFMSLPLKYQPHVTQLFVEMGTRYLRYGPYPQIAAFFALIAFSSITILLASVALFDALRSSGRRWLALVLLAPLALFALIHLGQVAVFSYCYRFALPIPPGADPENYPVYFAPLLILERITDLPPSPVGPSGPFAAFLVEMVKWFNMLVIAIWLTMAQFAVWRDRKRTCAGSTYRWASPPYGESHPT